MRLLVPSQHLRARWPPLRYPLQLRKLEAVFDRMFLIEARGAPPPRPLLGPTVFGVSIFPAFFVPVLGYPPAPSSKEGSRLHSVENEHCHHERVKHSGKRIR